MHAQLELRKLMNVISEDSMAAGWHLGLEHVLWLCIEEGPRRYGRMEIDEILIKQLKDLSQEADGWFYWDDMSESTVFCSLEEWKKKYSKEEAQKAIDPLPLDKLFTTH